MKRLQTLQKTFRIFQTLTGIAMAASFVWAGLSVIGLLCAFAWYSGVPVMGVSREILLNLTLTGSLSQMTGVLLSDAVFALFLLCCSRRIALIDKKQREGYIITSSLLGSPILVPFLCSGLLPPPPLVDLRERWYTLFNI